MPPMSPFFAGSELRGKLRGDFSEECRRDHEHTVKQLRSEKVHLLYENLWQPVVLSVVVAGLLVITLWPVVPATTLLGWLGALSLVSLLRLWLAHYYARLPKEQRQHPRWLWRFAIGTLVVGCVWGAGSFLLFTPDHYGQLAALCIVFSGIIGRRYHAFDYLVGGRVFFRADYPAVAGAVFLDGHDAFHTAGHHSHVVSRAGIAHQSSAQSYYPRKYLFTR